MVQASVLTGEPSPWTRLWWQVVQAGRIPRLIFPRWSAWENLTPWKVSSPPEGMSAWHPSRTHPDSGAAWKALVDPVPVRPSATSATATFWTLTAPEGPERKWHSTQPTSAWDDSFQVVTYSRSQENLA